MTGERLLDEGERLVGPAELAQDHRAVAHRTVLVSERFAFGLSNEGNRPLEMRVGPPKEAESRETLADRVMDPGADEGRIGESPTRQRIPLEPQRRHFEHVDHAHVPTETFFMGRSDRAQDVVVEKAIDRSGNLSLLRGILGLAGRLTLRPPSPLRFDPPLDDHLAETFVRPRHSGEPDPSARDSDQQSNDRQDQRHCRDPMPPDELSGPVPKTGWHGFDGTIRQKPPEVQSQRVRGRIPAPGVFVETAQNDPVDVRRHVLEMEHPVGRFGSPLSDQPGAGVLDPQTRSLRLDFANHPQKVGEPDVIEIERRHPADELVEKCAQCIDVASRIDRVCPVDLFGTHESRRADQDRFVGTECLLGQLVAERLGHAKVDDLRLGRTVHVPHHHVGRFDVSVENPPLMSVLESVTDPDEKLETVRQTESVLLGELGDRRSMHELHDEVRTPILVNTTVEDLGDVGMVHHRERLTLGLEARHDLATVHTQLDQLERHLSSNRLVLAGEPDRPHPPATQGLDQLVPTDPPSGSFAVDRLQPVKEVLGPVDREHPGRVVVLRLDRSIVRPGRIRVLEQPHHLLFNPWEPGSDSLEKSLAFGSFLLVSAKEHALDQSVPLRVHGSSPIVGRGCLGGAIS